MSNDDRWQRADDIFDAALDLPREDRGAYLDRACGGDVELRALVDRLLAGTRDLSTALLDVPEDVDALDDSLLGGPLLEGLASELVGLATSQMPKVGSTVAHYRILEELGGGGMGVVFKAEDLKLKRTLALKFLSPTQLRDLDAKERFHREAQAASALDHPNVCTIFEIGVVDDLGEDPLFYIAMAFIEGQTLRQILSHGPLRIDDAVRVALQVAAGLGVAHRRGILHRDVKPPNVLVTHEGQVKLVDFGLAKVADEDALTRSGTALGTPSYMAPEQLAGEADARSDVWSLGVVLYEMLTGRKPFEGPQMAIPYAILNQDPEPVDALRREVPRQLAWVVARALSKDPEQRYSSMGAFANAIESAVEDVATPSTGSFIPLSFPDDMDDATGMASEEPTGAIVFERSEPPEDLSETIAVRPSAILHSAARDLAEGPPGDGPDPASTETTEAWNETKAGPAFDRRTLGPVVLLVLLALVAAVLSYLALRRDTPTASAKPSGAAAPVGAIIASPEIVEGVAVLPFAYRGSPEAAYLAEGMVDLLSAKLDGGSSLRSVDPRAVLAAASATGRPPEPSDAARLAERLGARLVLLGSVLELHGKIHLDATLYEITGATPAEVAKASSEGRLQDLFALVDALAAELLVAHQDDEMVRLAAVTTSSLPALRAFLGGEHAYRSGRFPEATEALERALAEDPGFALAWYRLSLTHEWRQDTEASRRAADNAARFRERLPQRQRQLVDALLAATRDEAEKAEQLYRGLLSRYPASVEGWYGLAELLFHCGPLRGYAMAPARDAWERVLELEPRNALAALHLARLARVTPDLERLAKLGALLGALLGDLDDGELLLHRSVANPGFEEALDLYLGTEPATSPRWLLAAGLPYIRDAAQLASAERRIRTLLAPGRSDAERALGHRVAAVLAASRGRFTDAEIHLADAAALEPAYSDELGPLFAVLPFRPLAPAWLTGITERLAAQPITAIQTSRSGEPRLPHARFAKPLRFYQIGLLHARLGRAEAEVSASNLEDLSAFEPSCMAGDLAQGVRAELAYTRGQSTEALAILEARRCQCNHDQALLTPLVSQVRERYRTAEILVDLGRDDEALAILDTLTLVGFDDVLYLAPSHRLRGEIHARRGEDDVARRHFEIFVELWGEADAELRPQVEAARAWLGIP